MNYELTNIYNLLLKNYGLQGWWPLTTHDGSNPTKSGSISGYHVNDYSLPKTKEQIFEVCLGAILTQNTSWPNVEKALLNLKTISPIYISNLNNEDLKQSIRPAGYFNQKADYIKNFTNFFLNLKDTPSRDKLLTIKGIGNETADSILLYAFKQPEFVVDAYTKRIFSRLGFFKATDSYKEIKDFFESNLKKDVILFQEFHALIVEHAKRFCQKSPYCTDCFLRAVCKF